LKQVANTNIFTVDPAFMNREDNPDIPLTVGQACSWCGNRHHDVEECGKLRHGMIRTPSLDNYGR
jgi:hypothetical protein